MASAFWGGFAGTVLGNRQSRAKMDLAAKLEADLLERRQIFEQMQNDTQMMARRDEQAMQSEWENRQAERLAAERAEERKMEEKDRSLNRELRRDELNMSAADRKENRALREEMTASRFLAQQARQQQTDAQKELESLIATANTIDDDPTFTNIKIGIQASDAPYAERLRDLKLALAEYQRNKVKN